MSAKANRRGGVLVETQGDAMSVSPLPAEGAPANPPAAAAGTCPAPEAPPEPRPSGRRRLVRALVGLVAASALAAACYYSIYPQASAWYHWRKAQVAIDAYALASARHHLEYCVQVWPKSAETHFLLGRVNRRLGDFPPARAHLEEAQELHWLRQEVFLEYDLIQAQAGMVRMAEPALRARLAQGHADERLILEALVIGCVDNDFFPDAHRWVSLWREHHPDDWLAVYWSGRVYEAAHQDDLAAAKYEKALELKPDFRVARLRLGEAQMKLSHVDAAREQFLTVLKDDSDNTAALLALARCQRALETPLAERRATLDRLLALKPDDIDGLLLRAKTEVDADPAAALPWLQRAERVDPFNRTVNQEMVLVLHVLHRDNEADIYRRRSSELNETYRVLNEKMGKVINQPQDPDLRYEVGKLLLKVGRREEALRWFINALLLNPSRKDIGKSVIECLHTLGDPKLEALYRDALSASPATGGHF
jgi:tetratricopeptide (TPR) repeat protein